MFYEMKNVYIHNIGRERESYIGISLYCREVEGGGGQSFIQHQTHTHKTLVRVNEKKELFRSKNIKYIPFLCSLCVLSVVVWRWQTNGGTRS